MNQSKKPLNHLENHGQNQTGFDTGTDENDVKGRNLMFSEAELRRLGALPDEAPSQREPELRPTTLGDRLWLDTAIVLQECVMGGDAVRHRDTGGCVPHRR